MTEYGFDKKPHRMTDPPDNHSETVGILDARVILETDPGRIAYFAREATWGSIWNEPMVHDLKETLKEVAEGKVLGAAKEVPALGFRIQASRVAMDQMLRLRESAAGAQTTRDNDMREFNIIIPGTINTVPFELQARVEELIKELRAVYAALVDAGVPPQDARYVALPMGIQTHWIQIMNLRAFEKMCEQRLCNSLIQPETNYVVRLMRQAVLKIMPWAEPMLRSSCEKRGQCAEHTMLFPPCGAFQKHGLDDHGHPGLIPTTEFDPERHLYPVEQNEGMRFVEWDKAHDRSAPN
jgi:thymidylate synthase ThyX